MLDGMDDDMSRTQGLLGSTMRRLDGLIASKGGSYMCSMAIFIIFVFCIVWFVFSKSSSAPTAAPAAVPDAVDDAGTPQL